MVATPLLLVKILHTLNWLNLNIKAKLVVTNNKRHHGLVAKAPV